MVLVVGFLVFLLLVFGLDMLPSQSPAAIGLESIGQTLIGMGGALGDILQLPVTVPLYLMGQDHSLALIQQNARHDVALWLMTWAIWAMLAFLTLGADRQAAQR